MKYTCSVAAASLLLWVGGCASPTSLTVRQPLGPAPSGESSPVTEGALQVYSARKKAAIDVNRETFFWNQDFGRNDFLYESGHTDYTIYSPQGKVLQQVRNARDRNDDTPAVVTLPAGSYRIEAEAERNDGVSLPVNMTVVIKPGQTTPVHLERDWAPPATHVEGDSLVRVYDGRLIGWRAENLPDTVSR